MVLFNYAINKPDAVATVTFEMDETTEASTRLQAVMELADDPVTKQIKFKVDYAKEPSLEGKTIGVTFRATFQSEVKKVSLKLIFKEPLNFSGGGSVPELRQVRISNKGLLTVKFDQNMQFDIAKLNEDLDR